MTEMLTMSRVRARASKICAMWHAALLIGLAAGCSAEGHVAEGSFKAVEGIILVREGSLADIKAAIVEYDGLTLESEPEVFRVELHPQSAGGVAVLFPNGLPAYDMANMTGWLNAPPCQEAVYDAVSWATSPGDGAHYHFSPELENAWGDTLIGTREDGRTVRVYLPETGMSKLSARSMYVQSPDIEISAAPDVLEVTLDKGVGFGNPRLMVNHPDDHDWRPPFAPPVFSDESPEDVDPGLLLQCS